MMEFVCETKDIVVDKHNINLFDVINPRQIRNTQVNNILRSLKQGIHFDTPFVININNGTKRIRVLDGGHRTEALKRYFEQFPDDKIKIKLMVYKDLTESQEREKYTLWNIGVKQTTDDFINCYKFEIPEFENMLSELPVAVYPTKNKMRLRYVVDAYLSSKQVPYTGGMAYDRLQWLGALKKITYSDVEAMKRTFAIITEIFNPKDITDFNRLSAFKTGIFKALFCLIRTNDVFLGRQYIIKRMKTVLANSSILEKFKSVNKSGSVEAYIYFRQLLNDGNEHQFK